MSNTGKAINGGKWITVSTVISTLFQFGQVAVLARLLDPDDFGVVSVSTLIITFFQVFTNLGFSNSIIYKQENDRRVLSTIYVVSILVGILIFVVATLSVPYVVAFYREPRLTEVLSLAAWYFLIVYFGQIYYFLLEKELQFRSVAIIDIAGTVIGSITAITLALNQYHELSLVIGSLTQQAVRTTLQVIIGWRYFVPMAAFRLSEVREHLRFGVYNLGDGLLGFIQSNADNIFIGGILGVKMLGYYTIAYQLAVFPSNKLNPIILQVAYPILAKMKDETANLKRSYLKILDFISYCNFPLLAGLYITADSVVPLLYGQGWEQTITLVKLFVLVSLLGSLSHPLFTLAFTKGKPNLLFYLNLGTLIIKIPLVYILGTTWGVMGVALSFVIATLLNTIANFMIVHHLIGDFIGTFFQIIAKTVLFCLLMMGTVFLYQRLVGYEGIVHTVVQIGLGGAVYIGLTLLYKLSLPEILAFRRAL